MCLRVLASFKHWRSENISPVSLPHHVMVWKEVFTNNVTKYINDNNQPQRQRKIQKKLPPKLRIIHNSWQFGFVFHFFLRTQCRIIIVIIIIFVLPPSLLLPPPPASSFPAPSPSLPPPPHPKHRWPEGVVQRFQRHQQGLQSGGQSLFGSDG